jgi:hypothetical protein
MTAAKFLNFTTVGHQIRRALAIQQSRGDSLMLFELVWTYFKSLCKTATLSPFYVMGTLLMPLEDITTLKKFSKEIAV